MRILKNKDEFFKAFKKINLVTLREISFKIKCDSFESSDQVQMYMHKVIKTARTSRMFAHHQVLLEILKLSFIHPSKIIAYIYL